MSSDKKPIDFKSIANPLERIREMNMYAWEIRRSYPSDALQLATAARQLADDHNNREGLAYSFRCTGTANYLLSLYDDALTDLNKAIPLFEAENNQNGLATTIRTIGNVHHSIDQNEEAIEHYHRALDICKKLKDLQGAAYNYGNIGYVLQKLGQYEEALGHINKAVKMMEELDDPLGLADAFNNLGRTYLKTEKFEEAVHYFTISLEKAQSINHLRGIAGALANIGSYHQAIGENEAALQQYEKAEKVAREMGERQLIYSILKQKSEALEAMGKFQEALEVFKVFESEKSSVLSTVTRSTVNAIKAQNDLERSENEKEIFRLRNIDLVLAKNIIEAKNKDILDSIFYAERIQNALLPDKEDMDALFPDSFVIFSPRDIIGGDFYWLDRVGDAVIVALGDCTGHGVPGAIMSMMGHNLLRQIIHDNNVDNPAKALQQLDIKVADAIGKSRKVHALDGMDIAMCSYNTTTKILSFSGAKMPLFVVRKGELQMVKGDKIGIGDGFNRKKEFTLHAVPLEKGDQVIITSDGFADQFGGPEGKKFMRRRMMDLLQQNAHLLGEQQRQNILKEHLSWKGDLEQVDDICMLGFRIP